jgi:hypothetical protein
MNATAADLEFPVFDDTDFPAPQMTLEEWVEWLDWCKRELVSAENLERWIHDPNREAVPVRFVL